MRPCSRPNLLSEKRRSPQPRPSSVTRSSGTPSCVHSAAFGGQPSLNPSHRRAPHPNDSFRRPRTDCPARSHQRVPIKPYLHW